MGMKKGPVAQRFGENLVKLFRPFDENLVGATGFEPVT